MLEPQPYQFTLFPLKTASERIKSEHFYSNPFQCNATHYYKMNYLIVRTQEFQTQNEA